MSPPAGKDTERPADYAAWRRSVEKTLGDVAFEDALTFETGDGFDLEPLYTAESTPSGLDLPPVPGAPPYTRGTRAGDAGWRIAQEVAHPQVAEAAEAMRLDQRNGVQLLWLRIGDEGIRLAGAGDVEELVANLESGTSVVLEIGEAAPPVAAWWLAAWRRRGLEPRDLIACFGGDPLAELAAAGEVSGSLEEALRLDEALRPVAELTAWAAAEAPGVRTVLVSGSWYHELGATPAQELAFALAAGVEYLRGLTEAGLTVDAAAAYLDFRVSAGRDFFGEIAKLRAARLLWSKVVRAAGGSDAAQAMRLHARTSRLETSRLDPWMNLVRATAQSFAAAAGGAETIVCAPYDQVLGEPSQRGRRLAANVQHILIEEARVDRVVDPAGGSWYLESLTNALARSAWRLFQEVERRGGMARGAIDGMVAEHLAAAAEDRRRAVAEGHEPVVGASVFVDPAEAGTQPLPAADGELESRPGLTPFRLAEPFEHGRGEPA